MQGGVGKTVTAVNLAYLSALSGERTLLCDLDPQSAAGYYYSADSGSKTSAKKLVKEKSSIEKAIIGTEYAGLDILPSDLSYRKLDFVLEDVKKPRKRLYQLLQPLESRYSWVFLDCPPGLSLITENVFYASSDLLMPLRPTEFSIRIYHELVDFLTRKKIEHLRIIPFFSMVNKDNPIHQQTIRSGDGVIPFLCETSVVYDPEVDRMEVDRKPVPVCLPDSPITATFNQLWHEVKQLFH